MQEASFWRHYWKLLTTGLLVILFTGVGGGFILLHAQAQAPQEKTCGEITLPQGGMAHYAIAYQGGSVGQVEQCFVQAYHSCQNASISLTWMGVDAGTHETLTVVPHQGQCQLISSSQPYRIGMQVSPPVTNHTCQGLTLTADSLIAKHCGDADETIARTESCGIVSHSSDAKQNKQAEDCFVRDKQQCSPAELISEPGDSAPAYQFEINSACHILWKASANAPGVTCTGMVQQADGLHFQNCGPDGEILVPANP